MAKPRCTIIDESVAGVFHCFARCVRRSRLCGFDRKTGKDYSYRRTWIIERVMELAALFAIEVHAFAVMQNHLHLVLRNRPDLVEGWSDEEVIRRACKIFPRRFRDFGVNEGQPTPKQLERLQQDKKLVGQMRRRLSSISWFMRQIMQQLAARANKEDGYTGHFWEGRFQSLPALDVFAMLAMGMYIDLNQIAAGEVDRPERATYSSVWYRIQGLQSRIARDAGAERFDGCLAPISSRGDGQAYRPAGTWGALRASDLGLLEISLETYLQLLDWAHRNLHRTKGVRIPHNLKPILERIGVSASGLLTVVNQYESLFTSDVGRPESLEVAAQQRGKRRHPSSERVAQALKG